MKKKSYPAFLCLSHITSSPSQRIPQPLYFIPTYQDSGDYVSSVLQAVSVVAASHEAGGSHILFIFIPVANLREGKYVSQPGPGFIRLLKVSFGPKRKIKLKYTCGFTHTFHESSESALVNVVRHSY